MRDAENRAAIVQLFADGFRFLPDGAGHALLLLGEEGWPFPIPLRLGESGWFFDVVAGREDILARRIGLNELETIEMMLAYVDAQITFRRTDHDGDGVMEFAAGILPSGPDTRDGLFGLGQTAFWGN